MTYLYFEMPANMKPILRTFQVKFHEIASYQTVHSINFPSPVLTAAVAADDSIVCAGMSDGLVQFLHRKDTPEHASGLLNEK